MRALSVKVCTGNVLGCLATGFGSPFSVGNQHIFALPGYAVPRGSCGEALRSWQSPQHEMLYGIALFYFAWNASIHWQCGTSSELLPVVVLAFLAVLTGFAAKCRRTTSRPCWKAFGT